MFASTTFLGDSSFAQTGMTMGAVLYEDARARGRRSKVRSLFSRQPNHLVDVADLTEGKAVRGHRYAGTQVVPIGQIRGSEGRSRDFDADFNPVSGQTRQRWTNIANARKRGDYLPAVELIQVGDAYAVRDGHHRISVARALGSEYVEAHVTVWELAG